MKNYYRIMRVNCSTLRRMPFTPDQTLLALYNRTQFMVRAEGGEPVYFTMGDATLPEAVRKKQFAIITAWNPMNNMMPLEENRSRNRELEDILKEQKYVYYPSLGTCEHHVEESFTIEQIPQADAVALGKRFGQHAIVFCDGVGVGFLFP